MNVAVRLQDNAYPISDGTRAVASEEHLALLRQGTAIWNEWRAQNRDEKPDFSGADLSEMLLSGINLGGAGLREVNLWETDLAGRAFSRPSFGQPSWLEQTSPGRTSAEQKCLMLTSEQRISAARI